MPDAYSADKIFTGKEWINNAAVIIEKDVITAIAPLTGLPASVNVLKHAPILAPAFIDIQIYGASSKLFSAFPSADSLYKLKDHCNKGGTKYFLPTIATNAYDVIRNGIDAMHYYRESGGEGIPGLHIEGPWINKIKRGAHIENFIHAPEAEEVRSLLEYRKGAIKIITLAPEVCSKEII
ncbi:MAG: N-acetylglucosamine-6-phosphate deacetylase, partial [Ginsengibacter sp.]